ncbi:MAG: nicotinate-nicotinamide nucleotide adenylyltransferase [Akkermansia sp.]
MTVKLCIFGGSFDPVHEGPVCVAGQARKYCGLDRVLFMPCSLSPLKEQAPAVTDDQRCRMIDLALRGLDWAVLDRTDLNLPPPSWS